MLDLNLTSVGWIHTIASLAAIIAFVPVMLSRKGSHTHRKSGRVYAIAYVVVCVTSLGLYGAQRFWFPHWLALAGLAVLAAGYMAVRFKPRGWRYAHLTAMLLSAYNLFGGGINEVFLRVRPLRALAGPDILASPLVGMAHGIVMLVFVVIISAYCIASALRRGTVAS